MSVNRGKDLELIVKDCAERVDGVFVQRLYDPQGGFASVANPCDFIMYRYPKMYMIECKSVHGNTIPIYTPNPNKRYGNISNTQWLGLLEASKYGIVAGIICWWVDKDVTRFIPIQSLEGIRSNGAKSIRYDAIIPNSYTIVGTKKRVYFDYDFRGFFEHS